MNAKIFANRGRTTDFGERNRRAGGILLGLQGPVYGPEMAVTGEIYVT